MIALGGSDELSAAAVGGATEEVALEQEDGDVSETEDGALETEGEAEVHSFCDGGTVTADD